MIRLFIRKGLYSYERIIFPIGFVQSQADIIRYMRFYQKPDGCAAKVWDCYRTPVVDLTENLEQIRSRYTKELRYEVRRAARELIQYHAITEPDSSLLEDIMQKYYGFCDSIGLQTLKTNFDEYEIRQMTVNGQILITKAEYGNGWVFHIYQVDGQTAMLWFSFSNHREQDGSKSMAGWANRGLHDYDISFLKERGYHYYDFGNIASEESPNSIDVFKMSFGGKLKTVYCCFVGNTWKGRILVALRNMKNNIKLRH